MEDFLTNMEKQMDSKQIKKFEVVERYPDNMPKIIYTLAKIPMMTDRENLITFTKRHLPDGRCLCITKSIDLP